MHLEPLFVQVLPRLLRTGSEEHVTGVLAIPSIDVGTRHFALTEGIAYDLDLINTGEAVLLSGRASAELNTTCDRCLKPTELNLVGEVQGYYLFDKASVEETEGLEVYEEVDREGRVDLAPPILAAIVVELPTVTVCGPDCSGPDKAFIHEQSELEHADSVERDEDGINPESPFAALKDFTFDDTDN